MAITALFSEPPVKTYCTWRMGEAESDALASRGCIPVKSAPPEGFRTVVTGFGISTLGVQLTRH